MTSELLAKRATTCEPADGRARMFSASRGGTLAMPKHTPAVVADNGPAMAKTAATVTIRIEMSRPQRVLVNAITRLLKLDEMSTVCPILGAPR
ncbi:MAG: hypothetical protein ACRCS9_04475 [Hyphomicrobium sp.]